MFRGVTRGAQFPGRRFIMGGPKSPNNVISTFFNTAYLLLKDLRFKNGGAKLASCPGRHLTSLDIYAGENFRFEDISWVIPRATENAVAGRELPTHGVPQFHLTYVVYFFINNLVFVFSILSSWSLVERPIFRFGTAAKRSGLISCRTFFCLIFNFLSITQWSTREVCYLSKSYFSGSKCCFFFCFIIYQRGSVVVAST